MLLVLVADKQVLVADGRPVAFLLVTSAWLTCTCCTASVLMYWQGPSIEQWPLHAIVSVLKSLA